ncbi:hypothetical protein [Streptomyces sp. NBC_01320]|nr:hypothetical protein OG395_12350 [Streptomyces sp. NBC_01320]
MTDLAGRPISKQVAIVVTSRAHLSAAEISARAGISSIAPRHRLA